MPKEINLRSPTVKRHKSQVATYGTQTPLSSTAVERGSTRWLAGSYVSIEGILDVAGTFNVSGTTVISGSLTIAGQTGITGPLTIQGVTDITGQLNVTGPTKLNGVTDIGGDTTITGLLDVQGDTTMSGKLDVTGPMATKGTLSVEGVTTLKSDLNVIENARIKAGKVEIWPNNIALESATLTSDALLGLRLAATNRKVVVESLGGQAELIGGNSIVVARTGAIDLTSPSVNVSGALKVSGRTDLDGSIYLNASLIQISPSTPTTSSPPNLFISASGRLYKSTWTPST